MFYSTNDLCRSRFVSLMHQALHPESFNLSKLYDRLAILFHDELNIESEHSVSTGFHCTSATSSLDLSIDSADARFDDKKTALKIIDRASMRAHYAEAINMHHSQRPHVVTAKRQAVSLTSTSPRLKKPAINVYYSHPHPEERLGQLPTPPPSPNSLYVPTTLTGAAHDIQNPTAKHHQCAPGTLRLAEPLVLSRTIHTQPSNLMRKRTYSEICNSQPQRRSSLSTSVSNTTANVDLESLNRVEALQTARQRDQQVKARLERRQIAQDQAAKLYLSAISYKHSTGKRETCYVRYRPGSQILKPTGVALDGRGKGKVKARAVKQDIHGKRRTNRNPLKTTLGATTNTRSGVEKLSKAKKSKSKKKKSIHFPTSDTEDDSGLAFGDPKHQKTWERMLARLRERQVASMPVIDISVGAVNPKERKDVVQEVYEKVKRRRIERVETLNSQV